MKRQQGFTLIELIVVIVILGILAATALPKFVDLQADARQAKANGALGSIKAAASLAHAAQLASGAASNVAVNMEGTSVTMVNGYPTADSAGIGAAAQVTVDYSLSGGGAAAGSTLTVAADASHTACAVTYTSPVGAVSPTYSAGPSRANCE